MFSIGILRDIFGKISRGIPEGNFGKFLLKYTMVFLKQSKQDMHFDYMDIFLKNPCKEFMAESPEKLPNLSAEKCMEYSFEEYLTEYQEEFPIESLV